MSSSRLTISLIITSITLLLVLQAFWLRGVYNDNRRDLERDVSILFSNTVLTMADSLMEKNIRALPVRDSAGTHAIRFTQHVRTDSFNVIRHFGVREGLDSSSNVQLFIYTNKDQDSVKKFLRPIVRRFQDNPLQRAFTISITGDSLRLNDVKKKFDEALLKSGFDLPGDAIRVRVATSPQLNPVKRNVVFTPAGGYTAEFNVLTWLVIGRIAPQIAFAVALTLVTSAAFIVMYRNLRAQQRLMTLKNDFISNVTHELKTPIATVSVALEALKNFKGINNPTLTQEYLDIARYELDRLTMLTDKVLTTSLFDEKGIVMDTENVDMEKVIEGVVFAMRPVFEKREGSVQFEKTGSDFSIRGSGVHLTNVIYNLLDNAIKYSGGNPVAVVQLRDQGDHLSISVSDSGNGIPEEYHDKIFEKFFRLPTGNVHNVKGHGLGLSYVAGVIQSHGGEIKLKSKPGEGTTFTITLARKSA